MKWAFFYERQYNTPDRGDYYTMQVAMQIDRLIDTVVSLFKNLGSRQYQLQKYLIQFGIGQGNTETLTIQHEEEKIVLSDVGEPGELVMTVHLSELDPEKLAAATRRQSAPFSMWCGAITENARRLKLMSGEADAGHTGPGA